MEQMERLSVFEMSAVDLGFIGNKLTWHDKRWGKHSIKEKLDRGIASLDWRLCHP